MVRSGLGIGLLASYAMNEPSLVPLDIGQVIRIQINIIAMKERLQDQYMAVTFDWLREILGEKQPWLSPDSNGRIKPNTHMVETLSKLVPDAFGSFR